MITELNQRSREILRHVVDAYVETGDPVGSRTISKQLGMSLSPATIRNVMADLEELGLLYAPHTSAGRMPTETGLQIFVDGLLEIGDLSTDERRDIESRCGAAGQNMNDVLEQASTMLSGLSSCAGLVVAPKLDHPLKQLEFVQLGPGRVLAVMVSEDGMVENRVIELPPDIPQSALVMAGNYLNQRLAGRTLGEVREKILTEIREHQSQLDALSSRVVEAGLAVWSGSSEDDGRLIIKGQSRLLEDITAIEDLERIRTLFQALEDKQTLVKLLGETGSADGVQIFIGSGNKLFENTGCSMIVSPVENQREQIVGMIGVIGPMRINYGRIIPMVDYTSKIVGRLL